jgi:hypothetical protein
VQAAILLLLLAAIHTCCYCCRICAVLLLLLLVCRRHDCRVCGHSHAWGAEAALAGVEGCQAPLHLMEAAAAAAQACCCDHVRAMQRSHWQQAAGERQH